MMTHNIDNTFLFIDGEDAKTIETNFNLRILSNLATDKEPTYHRQKVTRLTSAKLITLFQELLNFMELGMTLNESIDNIATSNNKKLSSTCLYLLQQTTNGISLKEAFLPLLSRKHRFIYGLLPNNTTQENFKKSLSIILENLISKKTISTQLAKSIYYPFFIIQASVLSLIGSKLLEDQLELTMVTIYLTICLIQGVIIQQTLTGKTVYFLERFSSSLRYYNFFELLSSSLKSGESLQNSIKNIANSTQNKHQKKQLFITYHKLKLGFGYTESFPRSWFLGESYLALVNSNKHGNIDRALLLASALQKKRWLYILSILNKTAPTLSLLIAGFFVARVLLNIYSPLMEPY